MITITERVIEHLESLSGDLLNGGFKFGNSQSNRTLGCGTSFSV